MEINWICILIGTRFDFQVSKITSHVSGQIKPLFQSFPSFNYYFRFKICNRQSFRLNFTILSFYFQGVIWNIERRHFFPKFFETKTQILRPKKTTLRSKNSHNKVEKLPFWGRKHENNEQQEEADQEPRSASAAKVCPIKNNLNSLTNICYIFHNWHKTDLYLSNS